MHTDAQLDQFTRVVQACSLCPFFTVARAHLSGINKAELFRLLKSCLGKFGRDVQVQHAEA
jgi:hypothetical protein